MPREFENERFDDEDEDEDDERADFEPDGKLHQDLSEGTIDVESLSPAPGPVSGLVRRAPGAPTTEPVLTGHAMRDTPSRSHKDTGPAS